MANPERFLVTGGSGFIGSSLVRAIAVDGHQVMNIDVHPPRDPQQLLFWIKLDIRDEATLREEVYRYSPTRVIHLASDTDVSVEDISAFTTTIGGTKAVLSALQNLPELRRFIHISTQFVVKPGVRPLHDRFLQPYTVYGEAKAATERLVWETGIANPWYILRPTIVWGPNHLAFRDNIFKRIKTGMYLHPKSRRPIMRTFGYVDNAAEQIMRLALVSGTDTARVFYVGDATISYDLWADAFAMGLTGRPARRVPKVILGLLGGAGDLAKIVGLNPPIDSGRVFRMSTSSVIDLSATLERVGQPRVSFDAGIQETLSWLKLSQT